MTRQEMRDFAIGQVEWHTNQNEWLTRQIERINNRLKQSRKEDKAQKEFAQTYEGGKYAHLYEGNYQGNETRKLINERRRHQREMKKNAATIEHYKHEIEKYTDPADKPQEAPAAEAEQQPTETENAPQAATQAAEGTAQQADDITAAILGAIGAPAPAQTVTVTWANGTRATYSADMLDMIRTDPAALDIQDDETGELVYIKPDPDAVTLAPADAAQVWTEDGETITPEETTTDEKKEEENTMNTTANELQKYVDGIAADLRRLYEADPTDEEREAAEENGDACDLYSYFSDVLDIEYTISSRGDYLGARIAVALGGPNIYIDTREGYVKGYWGTDRADAWIPSEICEEIDSIMEEYYDMVRGA